MSLYVHYDVVILLLQTICKLQESGREQMQTNCKQKSFAKKYIPHIFVSEILQGQLFLTWKSSTNNQNLYHYEK